MTEPAFADFEALKDEQVEVLERVLRGRDLDAPTHILDALTEAGLLERHKQFIDGDRVGDRMATLIIRYRFPGDIAAIRFQQWLDHYRRRVASPAYRMETGRLIAGTPSAAALARVEMMRIHSALRSGDTGVDCAALGRARDAWIHAVMAAEPPRPREPLELDQLLAYRMIHAEAIATGQRSVEIDPEGFRALVEECIAVRGGPRPTWEPPPQPAAIDRIESIPLLDRPGEAIFQALWNQLCENACAEGATGGEIIDAAQIRLGEHARRQAIIGMSPESVRALDSRSIAARRQDQPPERDEAHPAAIAPAGPLTLARLPGEELFQALWARVCQEARADGTHGEEIPDAALARLSGRIRRQASEDHAALDRAIAGIVDPPGSGA